eukprot:770067-Rhodomonas_salina.1
MMRDAVKHLALTVTSDAAPEIQQEIARIDGSLGPLKGCARQAGYDQDRNRIKRVQHLRTEIEHVCFLGGSVVSRCLLGLLESSWVRGLCVDLLVAPSGA